MCRQKIWWTFCDHGIWQKNLSGGFNTDQNSRFFFFFFATGSGFLGQELMGFSEAMAADGSGELWMSPMAPILVAWSTRIFFFGEVKTCCDCCDSEIWVGPARGSRWFPALFPGVPPRILIVTNFSELDGSEQLKQFSRQGSRWISWFWPRTEGF